MSVRMRVAGSIFCVDSVSPFAHPPAPPSTQSHTLSLSLSWLLLSPLSAWPCTPDKYLRAFKGEIKAEGLCVIYLMGKCVCVCVHTQVCVC